jgi:glycosyltransferase involved in cell wall biosynthesis
MATLALCIPAYNAENYLPALLLSANNQCIPFDEILVYNDCSTDKTSEIAKSFSAIVIDGEVNVGCSLGKNKMAQIAKSDWLHFHDADDLLLPNFTEVAHKWMSAAKAPDIVLLHFLYKNFASGELLGEPDYKREDMLKDAVKFNIDNKVVNFALMQKKPFLAIGGFDSAPEVLYNEDRAFYTKASIAGLSFDYEKETTCINYFHPNSMSANNMARCAQASLKVWEKVINKTGTRYSAEISSQLLQNATLAATAGDWITTDASVKRARSIFPNQIPVGSKYFHLLYRIFPSKAFLIREIAIKYFTRKRQKVQ